MKGTPAAAPPSVKGIFWDSKKKWKSSVGRTPEKHLQPSCLTSYMAVKGLFSNSFDTYIRFSNKIPICESSEAAPGHHLHVPHVHIFWLAARTLTWATMRLLQGPNILVFLIPKLALINHLKISQILGKLRAILSILIYFLISWSILVYCFHLCWVFLASILGIWPHDGKRNLIC